MGLNELIKRTPVHSGVLVLNELASDCLVLTKRSEFLRSHPGEICFPGGIWEKEDENIYVTALRELSEELGVSEDRITLIKELQIEKTIQGSIIHPWFASIESIQPYHLNKDEVAGLILIPMSLVRNRENYKELLIDQSGYQFKTCQFVPCDELLWGATVRIMQQLII